MSSFAMDMFSYLCFCVLHAYVTLDKYNDPPRADEVILYAWFFTFAAEQFARVVCALHLWE